MLVLPVLGHDLLLTPLPLRLCPYIVPLRVVLEETGVLAPWHLHGFVFVGRALRKDPRAHAPEESAGWGSGFARVSQCFC